MTKPDVVLTASPIIIYTLVHDNHVPLFTFMFS